MTVPVTRRMPAVLGALALAAAVAACSGNTAATSGVPPSAEPAPSGAASTCPTSQPDSLPAGETRTVTIETDLGSIDIALEADLSPIAAGNFVALAECGYYDGVVFHRVVPGFVIQAGDGQYGRKSSLDPNLVGTGGPGYTIQDEVVSVTYERGIVAMARTRAPDSVGSQFFIVLDDAARGSLEQANTYQIIGRVTAGIETADAIAAAADAEIPSDPVEMTDVSVANP
ncbi:MAG TPA: peptidylprolyl isomerase [Clostridia bacterium]|nr:peptidylprolyl isomerase [Clostridia bacterium]